DAHQLPLLALLFLLFAQFSVSDLVKRQFHGGLIVPAVIGPAQRRLVRKLLGSNKILAAQISGVDLQLLRQNIDRALDEVRRLRHTEGTTIRDAARSLVRVNTIDLAKCRRIIVRAGAHTEKTSGKLCGLRRGIERAVIRESLHAQRLN